MRKTPLRKDLLLISRHNFGNSPITPSQMTSNPADDPTQDARNTNDDVVVPPTKVGQNRRHPNR